MNELKVGDRVEVLAGDPWRIENVEPPCRLTGTVRFVLRPSFPSRDYRCLIDHDIHHPAMHDGRSSVFGVDPLPSQTGWWYADASYLKKLSDIVFREDLLIDDIL